MISPRFTVLSVIAALLVSTTPVMAATDQAGADAVKALVQDYLDMQMQVHNGNDTAKLHADGDIIVTPMDDYYAVKTPHISIAYTDGPSLDMGIFTLNIAPGDQPYLWRLTMATPSPMTGNDNN